jgi:hypothetical protein
MFEKPHWNPDKEPHKSSWDLATEDKVRLEHVWAGGRTCPANASGIWSETRIYLVFLGTSVRRLILMIWTSPTHPMHPH